MLSVNFNMNDIASTINVWKQSEEASQETALRVHALLKVICELAGKVINDFQLTFRTFRSTDTSLMVFDFSRLITDEKKVVWQDKWILKLSGDCVENYGTETQMLVILPAKVAAFAYGNAPSFQAIPEHIANVIEIAQEGLAVASLEHGAIYFDIDFHNRWQSVSKVTYPLDNLVVPVQDRTIEELLNVCRVYAHMLYGILVCVEPKALKPSERKKFFNIEKNLTFGHYRQFFLVHNKVAQELYLSQTANPQYFSLESRTTQALNWVIASSTVQYTIPSKGTNVNGIDIQVNGFLTRFKRITDDAYIWTNLCSNFKMNNLNWKSSN